MRWVCDLIIWSLQTKIEKGTSRIRSRTQKLSSQEALQLPIIDTYVQDWTQALFYQYFIFGRGIWHFNITSYLTELSLFWWLYQWRHFVMLIMRNLNLISVQSWTHLISYKLSEIYICMKEIFSRKNLTEFVNFGQASTNSSFFLSFIEYFMRKDVD